MPDRLQQIFYDVGGSVPARRCRAAETEATRGIGCDRLRPSRRQSAERSVQDRERLRDQGRRQQAAFLRSLRHAGHDDGSGRKFRRKIVCATATGGGHGSEVGERTLPGCIANRPQRPPHLFYSGDDGADSDRGRPTQRNSHDAGSKSERRIGNPATLRYAQSGESAAASKEELERR
jgi:hypothetical protein